MDKKFFNGIGFMYPKLKPQLVRIEHGMALIPKSALCAYDGFEKGCYDKDGEPRCPRPLECTLKTRR